MPAIYRLRLNKEEELAAVYFNPNETKLPPVVFAPFFDGGEMVTPCYWGSHWPLARGNSTGRTIDDRIQFTPTHNSVMSWGGTPADAAPDERACHAGHARAGQADDRQALGLVDRHDRCIGHSPHRVGEELLDSAIDRRERWPARFRELLPRAAGDSADRHRSGRPDRDQSRHNLREPGLRAQTMRRRAESSVTLAGQPIVDERYAWDGRVLWLDATIETPTRLVVTFGNPEAKTAH